MRNYGRFCWTCAGYSRTRKKRVRLKVPPHDPVTVCPAAFKPTVEARLKHYEVRAALELGLFEDVPQPQGGTLCLPSAEGSA
jgi:hypothetical protein